MTKSAAGPEPAKATIILSLPNLPLMPILTQPPNANPDLKHQLLEQDRQLFPSPSPSHPHREPLLVLEMGPRRALSPPWAPTNTNPALAQTHPF